MEGGRKRGRMRMMIGTGTEKRGKNEKKVAVVFLIFQ